MAYKAHIKVLSYQSANSIISIDNSFRIFRIMASQVRIGTFIYRINPANDKELQRCTYGSSGWSRVTEFNGHHILDLLLASNGKDIEVYTDRYVYVREFSGNIRKK